MTHRCAGRVLAAVALLGLAACGTLVRPILPTSTALPVTSTQVAAAQPSPTATVSSAPLPSPQPTATPQPSPTPSAAWLPGEVRVYPGPIHYAGDLLTFEIPVENLDRLPEGAAPRVLLDGESLDVQPFPVDSPLRETVMVFRWAWDTTGQEGIRHLVAAIPQPDGTQQEVEFYVEIRPASERPRFESEAEWQQIRIPCCRIDYVSHTAAARDIDTIAERTSDSVRAVEARFGMDFPEVFPVVLIDNIWGNGAFAADQIVASYVDRAYVSLDLDSVLRHEATHYAARRFGEEAPTILVEGIAVYVAGGHYKPEPIPARAAALLPLELYVPLANLADNFRAHQHEVAYLEAAGLIAYLVEEYGWLDFLTLYGQDDIAGSPSEWLDEALRRVYGVGLDAVEEGYLAWLEQQPADTQVDDLRLTISLFETIRRYQDAYAPYQESLPPLEAALERGISAEFVREPTSPENLALETLLIAVRVSLQEGRTFTAEELLRVINATLNDGNFTREPVADFVAISASLLEAGWEVQQIDLEQDRAVVRAIHYRRWPQLETLVLERLGGRWQPVVVSR